jgi:nucleotide-binding universal stress UspA family protein
VKSLREVAPASVDSVVVKGPVVESILKQAADRKADLLVMTTHARGPLGRFWFGSTADALVRQSSIPIFLVPPNATPPNVQRPPDIPHVLLPLDGSELAEQAIEPALALGGKEQARYTLLRVVKPLVAVFADPTSGRVSGLSPSLLRELDEHHQREQAAANKYLEQLAQGLRSRSFAVHTQTVLDELPANAVLEYAINHDANAIAMTTRGCGGLKRLFVGSVAERVLRGATMPVLICPPVERLLGVG